MKNFPDKKYLDKMNPEEKKKFSALVSEHNKHWDEAHKYFNKAYNESEIRKSELIADKGFMHERMALKVGNKIDKFVDALKKKHGSTAMSSKEKFDHKLFTIYKRQYKSVEETIEKLKIKTAKYKKEGKTELYDKFKKRLDSFKKALELTKKDLKKLKNKYPSWK
jgi:hypothetical protein